MSWKNYALVWVIAIASAVGVRAVAGGNDGHRHGKPAHCAATWGGRVVVIDCDDGTEMWVDRVGLIAGLAGVDGTDPECDEYTYAPYWCDEDGS